MTQQELIDMQIGKWKEIKAGPMIYDILRVPNGWIYTTGYSRGSEATSCFVPEPPTEKEGE